MKKIFKWAGIILGTLIAILLVAYAFIYFRVEGRLNKQYNEVAVKPVKIPSDSAAIVLGEHIANIKGCNDCHNVNYEGRIIIDDPGLGKLVAPNLTTGKGGLTTRYTSYTDQDFVRAIKHGIGKDGKSLKLMPSYEYNSLSNEDLGALIAYIKSRPAVDNEVPAITLKPVIYVLANFDKFPLVSAEKVDHAAPGIDVVKPEVTPAYGKYLAISCTGCHRDTFTGGEPLIPGSPQVPNITRTGSVGKWTESQFIETLRTGVTPEGKKLDPQFMPWPMAKQFTDTEIKSLYLFLKNLPA
ncbi:c-type cytochrome [Adhaeribacter aquaticus]|uniref:c-type cytochrome n=1 Tax=Adhaeribacter aquaticus TaxID=299567 RepID=UPI0004116CC4|nr:c-type cytochrome [Adhaeribacter aquaticus]